MRRIILAASLLALGSACTEPVVTIPDAPRVGAPAATRSISFTGSSTTGFPIATIPGATPYAIGPSGQVAGSAGSRAFLWNGGATEILPLPPVGTQMQARDVNGEGKVVGIVFGLPRGNGAFLYEAGVTTLLAGPPGSSDILTEAYAINERGTIGGRSFVLGTGQVPVIWRDGVATNLGGAGVVYDVNDDDVAVGFSQSAPDFVTRPTLWRGGARITLPLLPGATEGIAQGINEAGVVVGYNRSSTGRYLPVVWSPSGEVTELPSLGGTFSFAEKINAAGVIAGRSEVPGQGFRAVVWRAGVLTDLGSVPGFSSALAWAINDDGIVAGQGGPGGIIWSLAPVDENHAPQADAGSDQTVHLSGSRTAVVRLDGTASRDPDAGQTLAFTWSENGVTLATGATPTVTLGRGVHTIVLGVTDGSLSSSDEVVVTVDDPTPPVVDVSVGGEVGANGWYVSNVMVHFTATDAESDITTPACPDVEISEDTPGRLVACTATSAGGSTSVERSIRRDATVPVIAFAGALEYGVEDAVAITCTASDATSGLSTSNCPGVTGDAYTFAAGPHIVTASATDNAGNQATKSVAFTVHVTATGVCALVPRWVENRGLANSLCQKLRNGALTAFENELRAQSGKALSADRAAILAGLVPALASIAPDRL